MKERLDEIKNFSDLSQIQVLMEDKGDNSSEVKI